MTTRLLPASEWSRLAGTELAAAAEKLPHDAKVLAVEDETGRLVGCWAAIPLVHVEGLWIAPEHRKAGSVGRRLWREMRRLLSLRGVRVALTGSVSPDVDALLLHAGAQELPGKCYVLPVRV